ncbi:hypothetical protein V2J09_017063 [Rumex salicifolius]
MEPQTAVVDTPGSNHNLLDHPSRLQLPLVLVWIRPWVCLHVKVDSVERKEIMSLIEGITLEVTVLKCNNLKVDEVNGRQEPYVCIEYGDNRYHSRTCTDCGENPVFKDKCTFKLVEGLRGMLITVYNNNTSKAHDFLGNGRVSLETVISKGSDESAWPIQTTKRESEREDYHTDLLEPSIIKQPQAVEKKKEKPCSTLCSIWCPKNHIQFTVSPP